MEFSIVQWLVEVMDGQLLLESQPGQGSRCGVALTMAALKGVD